jgi:putative flippase GtrA
LSLSGFDRIARLARFAVVGATGAIVYYVALWTLVEWMLVPVMLATSIAFVLVAAQNYVLHYLWTFDSDRSHIAALPRFLVMNVVGFCLNWGIMFAGVRLAEFYYLIVQGVAIAVVITWSVMLSHFWIFVGSER